MHGEISGIEIGQEFPTRLACHRAGVHRMPVDGIAGYGEGKPAESIVISGGYDDDEDHGNLIIYTGMGGQKNYKQVADQQKPKEMQAYTEVGLLENQYG